MDRYLEPQFSSLLGIVFNLENNHYSHIYWYMLSIGRALLSNNLYITQYDNF